MFTQLFRSVLLSFKRNKTPRAGVGEQSEDGKREGEIVTFLEDEHLELIEKQIHFCKEMEHREIEGKILGIKISAGFY